MDDVMFRINTALPVKTKGTIITHQSGGIHNIDSFFEENSFAQTVRDETVGGTGLVDRFEQVNYYNA